MGTLEEFLAKEELILKKFSVLDKGYVVLLDCMGDDHAIAEDARTSYQGGTRSVSDDRTLIRYLMRMSHTSPFEMAELKFAFYMPQVVWWQMVRHRMASANVESGRYSEMSEDVMATPSDGWRTQSVTNKQGSSGVLEDWPSEYSDRADDPFHSGETLGEYLTAREEQLHVFSREVYEERLVFGVAREQARKDLSLSTYIRIHWKIDLHNLLHFLRLRMDGHAQKEIREYATVIGREIVAPLFPLTWEAFEDYRLNAMSFSALDIEVVRSAMGRGSLGDVSVGRALEDVFSNKRERDECRAKLVRLGITGE